jgi:NAD(P)-dependent dehydrogenase (short-subunit alcohol dehydrogenase family)
MSPSSREEPLVVVVTGASSGIGRATAILLTDRGAQVVLAARSEGALLEAQRECHEGQTLVVPVDVSEAAQVEDLFAAAVDRYGRIDAVVHSAAVLSYGRFEDIPPEVFDASIRVTLLGTSNVARAALGEFSRQGGGNLIVVGSLLGKIAVPYMSSYVTAKWAVHGLVRCLQIEARETPGVWVSLVSPGGVDTPVYTQAGTYLGRHGRPPPPISTPEKVAEVILRRIASPSRESSVGLANGPRVLGFRLLPGVFDHIVTPLMRLGGLSRGKVAATPGNVLEPQPAGEATHGQWGHHWSHRFASHGRVDWWGRGRAVAASSKPA